MNIEQDRSKTTYSLEGRYANLFAVGYNEYEFVIDFGQCYSDSENSHMRTRIITGPAYARDLLKILHDAITSFEYAYGSIDDKNQEASDA